MPLQFMLICLLAYAAAGCTPLPLDSPAPSEVLDLTGRFVAVKDSGTRVRSTGSFSLHQKVMRKGVRKDAVILQAPVSIRAPLDGIAGSVELRGFATPVFNVGDGIQMDMLLVISSLPTKIFSRYYDAGRRAEDRDWIPLEIPLELPDTKDKWLEIRVSAGPQGNLTADWLALSSLQVMKRSP